MLRIQLLGPPRLEYGSERISFSARPKVLPLLGFLLLHPPSPLRRERIASALWPDETQSATRANLRRHLHYLHALLPPPGAQPWTVSTPQSVHWNAKCESWLDVDEFSACASHRDRLERAVELYAGDLMDGTDEPWLAEPRRLLQIRYASALLDLIAQHRARRSYRQAQTYARKLLAEDPWHEDAERALLAILYESGDRAGALWEFNRFARTLADEMNTEPMPETVAVFRAIQNGIPPPGASAPPPSVAAHSRDEPVLVAREQELQRLNEAWQRAASGRGCTVTVTGEAGIGKSRLVREAAMAVEAQGGLVTFGTTSFPESKPYQPIGAIVQSLCNLAPVLVIEPLWLRALYPLAPELHAHVHDASELPAIDAGRQRARLFEAVAVFLEAASRHRPLCVVLEDLQWAGPATLDLCAYLVRRLRRTRILWLFTWRHEDIQGYAALRELRDKLADAQTMQVHLRPLEADECARLLPAGAPFNERLYAYSGGIPLYFIELARAPGVFSATDMTLPQALGASLLARSEGLSDRARSLLEIAAVAHTAFDLDVAAGVTGWDESQCSDGLEELIDRRLVRERARGSGFAISHELVARAVYASIGEDVLIRRHRRIGHVLEVLHKHQPEFCAEIARHYEAAGDAERAAASYLGAASYALSIYAHAEAEAHARRALALAQGERIRFEALDLLCLVVALQGRRNEQATLTDELLEAGQPLQAADRCRALSRKIEFTNVTGERGAQRRFIERLENEAAACADPQWKACALEARAKLMRSTGNFTGENACFGKLESLIERDRLDRTLYAGAYLSHADALIYRGEWERARALLDSVLDSLNPATDRSAFVRTLMSLSRAALAAQDYAAMSEFAARAFQMSHAIGDLEGEALSLHNIANGFVSTFAVAQARDAYAKALALYERLGHQVGLASAYVDFGLFHTELGLLHEATTFYDRALTIAQNIDFPFVQCVANVNIAYCRRLGGSFGPAKTAAANAVGFAKALGSTHLMSAALGVLGAAETELGETPAALAHLRESVALRRPAGPSARLGDNLCALAHAYLRAGEVPSALAAATEMLDLYESNPKIAPQPTLWLLTGAHVCAASGDDRKASELENRAAGVLEARAALIPDAPTRTAFSNLPFNRALHIRC